MVKMSCNCQNTYRPCDCNCCNPCTTTTQSPICNFCLGYHPTNAALACADASLPCTTTTTTCKTACVEYKKDICVVHPGDPCYRIKEGDTLQALIFRLLSLLPTPAGCTTTTIRPTTSTTTTTTIIPTTTTTTCICPSTTTTTRATTTTTTTFKPCDCETYSLKNVSNVTQTYSYTNCSRVRFNNISLAAGATVLICVCDEDLTYNNNFVLALALGTGCNTSTTTSTTRPTTTTTLPPTTTTTTRRFCLQYRIQSTGLPASWSAQTCYGVPVGGSFTTPGQSIYTGCIWSDTLVLNNASIKELLSCPPPTSTTTSSTSTTSTTTAAPTTTTTTQACAQYAVYSETGGIARGILCSNGTQTITNIAPGQTVLTPCIVVGSIILNEASVVYQIPCGATTTTTTV